MARLKLVDQTFYTFAEAAEVLHPLFTVETLKKKAYEKKVPHHGGRGRGKVCFSNSDLEQIIAMCATPAKVPATTASEPVAEEAPNVFRLTSRSRALNRGKVSA